VNQRNIEHGSAESHHGKNKRQNKYHECNRGKYHDNFPFSLYYGSKYSIINVEYSRKHISKHALRKFFPVRRISNC
jgi:hypothetical protein